MSTKLIFKSDINNFDSLIHEFIQNHEFSNDEQNRILQAWKLLVENSQNSTSYEKPSYLHPLRVAEILANNKLDCDSIISAILHTSNDCGISLEKIKEKFGDDVFKIILSTDKILSLPVNSKTIQQSDAIRNMLFAICDDARVMLITLADRLDRIRNAKFYPQNEQHQIAQSVIEIWAPLADRLGMQNEKNEFEDLSLKYTNPQVFQQIKSIVSQKQNERSDYLEKATNSIYKQAEKQKIPVEIHSRAKHFYSIYQKMRKRNKEANEIFDMLALRILCETQTECYTLVGIVHNLWKPLDGRFKDYIAMPKSNGYQSLHTTVMCDGKPLEIQIRTKEMHNTAEHGIASHWLYKKGTSHELVEKDRIQIINKLQEFKTSLTKGSNFESLKNELLGDEIYVFTPKGDVKKLPAGATAIDFAYSIHSAIGEKIVAAKANGKIIPLTKPLENTQIIEIVTNPLAHPTQAQLKVVKTSKAHQKIHAWLVANDSTFGDTLDETSQIQKDEKRIKKHSKHKQKSDAPVLERKVLPILVQGEKNVLYNLAQCCKPKYPDLISGYVTRTKGVSIHRTDCLIYQRIPEKNNRNVQVSWDEEK